MASIAVTKNQSENVRPGQSLTITEISAATEFFIMTP